MEIMSARSGQTGMDIKEEGSLGLSEGAFI